ncbi:MAG: hypothetical protein JWP30_1966, partial [Homoserinimonas sp.]|nr:hypothetical protein [Homoserinimonas sp.]
DIARETVAWETPARRATSELVTTRGPLLFSAARTVQRTLRDSSVEGRNHSLASRMYTYTLGASRAGVTCRQVLVNEDGRLPQ